MSPNFSQLWVVWLLVARCCLAASGNCGSVTIRAVDVNGHALEPLVVSEFVSVEKPDSNLSASFVGSTGNDIPCGEYDVLVKTQGRNKRQHIQVVWPSSMFVLLVGTSFPDGGVIEGIEVKLVGGHDYEKMWVKVVKAASDDMCCTMVPVSRDGRFWVPSYDPVEYIFVVNSGSGVLFLGKKRIADTPANVKIDLQKGSISVVYPSRIASPPSR